MQQTKTSYTSTTSVMDAETSRYGVHASSVQHAKMLIYVRHASIRDCKDLTLKKVDWLKTTRFSRKKFKIKMHY